MYNLSKAYSQKIFNKRGYLEWRAPFIVSGIVDILQPKSVIDFGCGSGDLLVEFINQGIDGYGLEGTKNAMKALQLVGLDLDGSNILSTTNRVVVHDLRELINVFQTPFTLKYDLVLCFAVAEHIEAKYIKTFVSNLTNAANTVLFTAAPPGQKGHYHINCQVFDWWTNIFAQFDFKHDKVATDAIKAKWIATGKAKKTGINLYYKNLMCFKREGI